MAPTPRLRDYRGPAVLSYGFRPFFLCGSLYAGTAVLAWLAMLDGRLGLATTFAPRDWHIHEMLYGYLAAVMTGFLLTAIPNWTGRLPIQGKPLLVLVAIWIAGRLAVAISAWTGWLLAALIDASFLTLVIGVAAREIAAGGSRQNLKILGILIAFAVGNVGFHLEAHFSGAADYTARMGVATALMLIIIVGGRIVPSFTRNWLARQNPGRLPAPFGRLDVISIVVALAALLAWVIEPYWTGTGALLVAAGAAQVARLLRWMGHRTVGDRLVIILHIAYGFIPLGMLLAGIAALRPSFPASAGIHAWTAGAIGAMTLAVMSRASLGHTGRALAASKLTQLIYTLVVIGALLRICAALEPEFFAPLIVAAGVAWIGAFIGFGLSYWGVLTGPRLGSSPN